MTNRLANNFQFIDVGRNDPDKRDMERRTTEYVEIYDTYATEQVEGQGRYGTLLPNKRMQTDFGKLRFPQPLMRSVSVR